MLLYVPTYDIFEMSIFHDNGLDEVVVLLHRKTSY